MELLITKQTQEIKSKESRTILIEHNFTSIFLQAIFSVKFHQQKLLKLLLFTEQQSSSSGTMLGLPSYLTEFTLILNHWLYSHCNVFDENS